MNQQDIDRLIAATTVQFPPGVVPHLPHPKQSACLLLPHKEVLFGGQVGGGKSDYLLMAALQYVDVPGYSALILRSTYKSLTLPDGLIPRSRAWLDGKARWSSELHAWTFPSGATLTFGYLEHENDYLKYASSAYQFIGWEEVCEFKREEDYRTLFSRVRRPKEGPLSLVPIRVRATANPIGPGMEWVKRRFLDTPGPDRFFLPSALEDNPSLDAEEYDRALSELPPLIYQKLRHGDWSATSGGQFFPRDRFAIIGPDDVPETPWVCRFWDLAATEPSPQNPHPDWSAGVKLARDEKGLFYVFRPRHFRSNPDDVENHVAQTAREDGLFCYTRMAQDPGQAGKAQIASYAKLLAGFDFDGIVESGNKEVRAAPFAAQVRRGNVHLVDDGTGWISCYLDELDGFPYALNDDQVDGSSGAFNFLVTARPKKVRRRAYGPRI